MSLAKTQMGLVCILLAPVAQAQIEPTWMSRTMVVSAWPAGCPGASRGEMALESGPWEQGLAVVLPCPEGSIYAVDSHRSNIGQNGLEAAASLTTGMHGIRWFYSRLYLYDEYHVQFQVPERGYYRIVANTGARQTSHSQYSDFVHQVAWALVGMTRSDYSLVIGCESHGHNGGDQSDSRRALLELDPGEYEVWAFGRFEEELSMLQPDQISAHLRYDFSLTPVACPADINADAQVDTADLTLLLSRLGEYAASNAGTLEEYDFDGNLWVDAEDLAILLSFFGQSCD